MFASAQTTAVNVVLTWGYIAYLVNYHLFELLFKQPQMSIFVRFMFIYKLDIKSPKTTN